MSVVAEARRDYATVLRGELRERIWRVVAPDIAALGMLRDETLDTLAELVIGNTASAAAERADLLAYLARKAANARRVASANPGEAEGAMLLAQRLEALVSDFIAGLHEGAAGVAAQLGGSDGV